MLGSESAHSRKSASKTSGKNARNASLLTLAMLYSACRHRDGIKYSEVAFRAYD